MAGKKVAEELQDVPEEKAPHFWDWMGRMKNFKDQLDVAR